MSHMGLKLYYLILFESCLPFQDMLGEEYKDDYFNDTDSDDSNFISLDDSNGEEEFEEDFKREKRLKKNSFPSTTLMEKRLLLKKINFVVEEQRRGQLKRFVWANHLVQQCYELLMELRTIPFEEGGNYEFTVLDGS